MRLARLRALRPTRPRNRADDPRLRRRLRVVLRRARARTPARRRATRWAARSRSSSRAGARCAPPCAFSPAGFWTPAGAALLPGLARGARRTPARGSPGASRRSPAPAPGRIALFWQTFGYPTRLPVEEAVATLRDAWAAPAFGDALAAFDRLPLRGARAAAQHARDDRLGRRDEAAALPPAGTASAHDAAVGHARDARGGPRPLLRRSPARRRGDPASARAPRARAPALRPPPRRRGALAGRAHPAEDQLEVGSLPRAHGSSRRHAGTSPSSVRASNAQLVEAWARPTSTPATTMNSVRSPSDVGKRAGPARTRRSAPGDRAALRAARRRRVEGLGAPVRSASRGLLGEERRSARRRVRLAHPSRGAETVPTAEEHACEPCDVVHLHLGVARAGDELARGGEMLPVATRIGAHRTSDRAWWE